MTILIYLRDKTIDDKFVFVLKKKCVNGLTVHFTIFSDVLLLFQERFKTIGKRVKPPGRLTLEL